MPDEEDEKEEDICKNICKLISKATKEQKQELLDLCKCSETFKLLLDNLKKNKSKIKITDKKEIEDYAGEGVIGTIKNNEILAVPTNKTSLTVAHEAVHIAQGNQISDRYGATKNDPILDPKLGNILDQSKNDNDDDYPGYGEDFEARRIERKIANEAVRKCKKFIPSYDYFDGKKVPNIEKQLKP